MRGMGGAHDTMRSLRFVSPSSPIQGLAALPQKATIISVLSPSHVPHSLQVDAISSQTIIMSHNNLHMLRKPESC